MKKFLRKEGGFTLIELLVVILILAILIAIAVPSFLNQTHKAQDASNKSDNANAFRAMSAWAVDQNGSYSGFTTGVLQSLESGLNSTTVGGASGDDATFVTTKGGRTCTLVVLNRAQSAQTCS